jgi:hypothetical protein
MAVERKQSVWQKFDSQREVDGSLSNLMYAADPFKHQGA